MPKSRKTASSATVTKTAIDHATSILDELPEKPKENWSLREAVAYLQVQISSALSKGYSYEEIARMLTERGIEISASSLKSYLSAAKRQKDTAPKPGRTGRRSRKALAEQSTLIETAAPEPSMNGTAANAGESLNGAKQESAAVPETAESPAPRKRRTRSSASSATAESAEQPAAKSTRSTGAKTGAKSAAKSKSAPRTKSKTATETSAKRGQRQKKA